MRRGADPFTGEGEVRALARSMDWAATPLGPVDAWPPVLRDIVRTCLESPFPINLWCGEERVLIYNDAYRHVLGGKHPEALGRPGHEVWAEIWPEIEPLFQRIQEDGPPVFQEDAPFIVHRDAFSRDGGRTATADERREGPAPAGRANAWFTFSLSPIRDEAGQVIAFLNIVSETTGRKRAEQAQASARAEAERAEARLREVFSQAPSFMAVLRGPNHVFEYVNAAYYQLVGHRDLVGRPAFEALPDARGQGFEQLLNQVLESGEPFVGREVALTLSRTPDSPPEERYLDLVYYPITEADGTRSGVVAHGSDVTEHVLARREAQRARAEAEHANLAKSQFLATMSHEIRTPINAVMGYADLLDAGVTDSLSPSQQEYVDGIAASSRHLRGLVSDILDLAKIEAGEMQVEAHDIDLRETAASALRLVAPQADRRGLALSESWDCGSEVRVLGDEDRVRQILLNLLSNALKFTESGGTITLHCRSVERAPPETALPEVGPWTVIEVEDTGPGIDPDQLARVFEPFVQAEAGHTRSKSGTGLGLTISRRLARLMGGEITVRSELGHGSSFSLWLAPGRQERQASRPAPIGDAARATALDSWPLAPEEVPGLASAGRALLSTLDAVEEEWVEALGSDPRIRSARPMNRAQLADQTAELLAATAKILFVLEEGGGDRGLLRDAETIHELVARRHGRQRKRLGWDREELVWEYEVLAEVLDRALRREAPKRTAADLVTALGVVRRLVERAASFSIAEYDRADTRQDAEDVTTTG